MALIQCPECSKDISDSAPACPGCGHSMQAAPKKRGLLARMLSKKIFCPTCGYKGKPGRLGVSGGNCLITLILLCCFLIPGIIYIIWLDSKSAKLCCPRCKSVTVVPY